MSHGPPRTLDQLDLQTCPWDQDLHRLPDQSHSSMYPATGTVDRGRWDSGPEPQELEVTTVQPEHSQAAVGTTGCQ